jgi:hypothetical protein
MFNCKIDHTDMNNYKSLDRTVGTYEYWKKKFGDKFNDSYYYYLEVLSRNEYNEYETIKILNSIKQQMQEEQEKVLKEYFERVSVEPDEFNKLLREIKCTIKLYE